MLWSSAPCVLSFPGHGRALDDHIGELPFTCLNVKFHLVLTAGVMPFLSPYAASNSSLNVVLMWRSELSFDNFNREDVVTFISFKPSPTISWRECTKHCKHCFVAIAASTASWWSGLRSCHSSGSSRWSWSRTAPPLLGKHAEAFRMLAALSLIT